VVDNNVIATVPDRNVRSTQNLHHFTWHDLLLVLREIQSNLKSKMATMAAIYDLCLLQNKIKILLLYWT